MAVRLEWFQRKVEERVELLALNIMTRAALSLEGRAKRLMSVANRDGVSPSAPGEAPRVVSGTLRANVAGGAEARSGGLVVAFLGIRKGPADPYGLRQEVGFIGTDSLGRNVVHLPRPYLIPTVRDFGAKEIGKAIKSLGGS